MYISERCAECLYSKQEEASKDPSYLKEVRELLDARRETDTAPYMVYLFDRAYQKRFGAPADYSRIKKGFRVATLMATVFGFLVTALLILEAARIRSYARVQALCHAVIDILSVKYRKQHLACA